MYRSNNTFSRNLFSSFGAQACGHVGHCTFGLETEHCDVKRTEIDAECESGVIFYGMVFSNIIGGPIKKKGDYCWFLSNTAKVAIKLADGGQSRCVAHSEIALDSHAEFILLGCPMSRTGPKYVGAPSRLIIWRPFKPTFFNFIFLQRRTGLASIFEGACPKCK